ncbi:hypothetical protein M422DRAFT_23953 [Sphaerobolus stellatus SS14]|nr:hypothetical protein M422DRAFT_23953 [Sphaerobolus stellatus SS14]
MGRTKGTKNRAGHKAGGARKGAGRKPKANDDGSTSLVDPQSTRIMPSDLPPTPSPATNYHELAGSAYPSPAGPPTQQLLTPITPYPNPLPQLGIDIIYPQEPSQPSCGPSSFNATQLGMSWGDMPYAMPTDASQAYNLSPQNVCSDPLYGEGIQLYSPGATSPDTSRADNLSPNVCSINLYEDRVQQYSPGATSPALPVSYEYPSYDPPTNCDATSPFYSTTYLPNPNDQAYVGTSYSSPNVQTSAVSALWDTQSPLVGSNTALITTPANQSLTLSPTPDMPPPSPYPASEAAFSQPLLTIPLPSPTSSELYTSPHLSPQPLSPQPLPSRSIAPVPPPAQEFRSFNFPYPLPAAVANPDQQYAILSNSTVKRRRRRCLVCVDIGREHQSYECSGRGDRNRCPFVAQCSTLSPPRRSQPQITFAVDDTLAEHSEPVTEKWSAFESASAHEAHSKPTGALQMAYVFGTPSSQVTTPFEPIRRRARRCRVCVNNGKEGNACPGRGNRTLCQYYDPAQVLV